MGSVIATFGRFQPPHRGHLYLLDTLEAMVAHYSADRAIVFVSPTESQPDNPLPWTDRVAALTRLTPPHVIISPDQHKTPIKALHALRDSGISTIHFVIGAERKGSLVRYVQAQQLPNVQIHALARVGFGGEWAGRRLRALARQRGQRAHLLTLIPPELHPFIDVWIAQIRTGRKTRGLSRMRRTD